MPVVVCYDPVQGLKVLLQLSRCPDPEVVDLAVGHARGRISIHIGISDEDGGAKN
jgi:hypothetical protein